MNVSVFKVLSKIFKIIFKITLLNRDYYYSNIWLRKMRL